jgi:hypothetical protein
VEVLMPGEFTGQLTVYIGAQYLDHIVLRVSGRGK